MSTQTRRNKVEVFVSAVASPYTQIFLDLTACGAAVVVASSWLPDIRLKRITAEGGMRHCGRTYCFNIFWLVDVFFLLLTSIVVIPCMP